MAEHLSPFAIVVRKDTFGSYELKSATRNPYPLTREHAIELILANLEDDAAVISTTGMISREVFEIRARRGSIHTRDFLTVGSMGHACQLALGVALEQPSRRWDAVRDRALAAEQLPEVVLMRAGADRPRVAPTGEPHPYHPEQRGPRFGGRTADRGPSGRCAGFRRGRLLPASGWRNGCRRNTALAKTICRVTGT